MERDEEEKGRERWEWVILMRRRGEGALWCVWETHLCSLTSSRMVW
jgi:hypothetical protein